MARSSAPIKEGIWIDWSQADTPMSFVGTVHPKRVSEPTNPTLPPRTTHYTNTCMSLEKQALGALLLAGQRSHVIAGQPAIPPMGASLPRAGGPKGQTPSHLTVASTVAPTRYL